MKAPLPPYLSDDNKYHCRTCGYLPANKFYPSLLKQRCRMCIMCRKRYVKRKRNASPAARILQNLRCRLRRESPELSKLWEESDVRELLEKFNYRSVISNKGGKRLCLVKIREDESLTPDNAQVVSTHEAIRRTYIK